MSALKMLDMYQKLTPEMQGAIMTITEFLYHKTLVPDSLSIYDMSKAKKDIEELGFEKTMGGSLDDFSKMPTVDECHSGLELPQEVKEDMEIFDEDNGGETPKPSSGFRANPIFNTDVELPEKTPDYAVMLAFVNYARLQQIKAKDRPSCIPAAIVKKEQVRKMEKENPSAYKRLLEEFKVDAKDKARNYILASHIMGLYKKSW